MRELSKLTLAFAAYTVLAVMMYWPVAANLRSGVPHDVGDPLFTAWLLWWNAQAVPFTEAWWNGPFFWPLPDTLALSEHLVGLSPFSSPLHWLGGNPQLVYNLLLLVSYPLSATTAHALCSRLTGSHAAGAVGGLVFGFNPYRLAQIAHIQVLASWWMPLALLALHRLAEHRTTRAARAWSALFLVSWLLQVLTNGYFLFYFSFLIGLWILWFLVRPNRFALAARLLLAWCLVALLLLPVLLRYKGAHARWGLARDLPEISRYSADLPSFVTGSSLLRWWPFHPESRPEQGLYPGVVPVALIGAGLVVGLLCAPSRSRWTRRAALIAVAVGVAFLAAATATLILGSWQVDWGILHVKSRQARKPLVLGFGFLVLALTLHPHLRGIPRRRSLLAFYLGAAVLCLAMCLGPGGVVMGEALVERPPYWWLMRLPGADALRVPTRFMMVATLPLAVAAALSFRLVVDKISRRQYQIALVGVPTLALILDSWPRPLPVHSPPEQYPLPAGFSDVALVELPLGESVDSEIAAMNRGIKHGRPVANGYSGHLPPPYLVLRRALQERDASALLGLATFGAVGAVIDRRRLEARNSRLMVERIGAPLVATYGDYSFYFIDQQQSEPVVEPGRLPIRKVVEGSWAQHVPEVHDGRLDSVWESTTWQRGKESLTIELAQAGIVGAISIAQGRRLSEYPRELSVDCSRDGETWSHLWKGQTAGLLFVATVRDPQVNRFTIRFPQHYARYIRLEQVGAAGETYWSVAEIEVLQK